MMNIDDIYLVIHHHWVQDTSVFPDERQRLQLALLILLHAYLKTIIYSTVTRDWQYLGYRCNAVPQCKAKLTNKYLLVIFVQHELEVRRASVGTTN
jgi:hypothetical protein